VIVLFLCFISLTPPLWAPNAGWWTGEVPPCRQSYPTPLPQFYGELLVNKKLHVCRTFFFQLFYYSISMHRESSEVALKIDNKEATVNYVTLTMKIAFKTQKYY